MKSTLTIFFAGFGAGLLVMCLWMGLTAEKSLGPRGVSVPVVEGNTNLLAPSYWQKTTLTFHRSETVRTAAPH